MTDAGYRNVECSFCGRHNRVVHMAAAANGLTICSVCTEGVAELLDRDTGIAPPVGGWQGRWPHKAS